MGATVVRPWAPGCSLPEGDGAEVLGGKEELEHLGSSLDGLRAPQDLGFGAKSPGLQMAGAGTLQTQPQWPVASKALEGTLWCLRKGAGATPAEEHPIPLDHE